MNIGGETSIKRAISPSSFVPSRPKRPKTSKACNACRKQKSRCERLAGDGEGCHRCSVIGIPCVFDPEPLSTDTIKTRRPRHILPKSPPRSPLVPALSVGVRPTSSASHRQQSPDDSRLHVLANTTEMLARATVTPSSSKSSPSNQHSAQTLPVPSVTTPQTPLSPETLSHVESTLFPFPRDFSSQEGAFAQLQSDWKRWIAPLTLVQNLVRRNAPPGPPDTELRSGLNNARSQDSVSLSALDEARLKKHFLHHYAPWLPVVRLIRNGVLDNISSFLSTVILATASRTLAGISHACSKRLRELALNYVGQIFANPTSHPLIESLYALLILVLWPLDPADDVELLVHGAKRMASAGGRFNKPSLPVDRTKDPSDDDDMLDLTRLWYAIRANETILTLGAGSIAPSPPSDTFIQALDIAADPVPTGRASAVASSGGNASDILLILQTNLHGIITAAMGERGISAVSSVSLSESSKTKFPFEKERDKEKIGQAIPRTRDAWLGFIEIVYLYLTRLGEWEIEFSTIACEALPSASHVYAILEIEYHYLCMIFVTHCTLTLCHSCPLTSAPDEIKYALWSWSVTGNKSAHAIIRLFNKYSASIPTNFSPISQERDTQTSCRGKSSLAVFSSAPDRLYAMVVLAVMLVLRHQVASSDYGHRRGPGESPPAGFTKQAESAIRKVISRMSEIGQSRACELPSTVSSCYQDNKEGRSGLHTPEARYDHSASRYVDILDALVRIWEEKRALKTAGTGGLRACDPCFSAHESRASSSASGQYSTTTGPAGVPPPYHSHLPSSQLPQQHQQPPPLPQQRQQQQQPEQQPPPVYLDLNLLGTELFSDAAAAFTWDSLGTIDWSTMGGMGGI